MNLGDMGGMGGGMGGMPGMGGMGGPGGMFGPQSEAKLKQNPRIAKYFEDPQFRNLWQQSQQNPQMMMQLVQSDPRFIEVFKELTGIDLLDMQEKEMKNRETNEDNKKKRLAEQEAEKIENERLR